MPAERTGVWPAIADHQSRLDLVEEKVLHLYQASEARHQTDLFLASEIDRLRERLQHQDAVHVALSLHVQALERQVAYLIDSHGL